MRRGLGRGLSQLRGDTGPEPAPATSTPSTKKSKAKEAKETKVAKVTAPEATPAPAGTSPSLLPVVNLHPNPRQPRSHFDEESLEDLTRSIREHGVLQPILARLVGEGKYEIIAGERRWRAAQRAGLTQVPVMVRRSDAQQSLEWALIENVQREDIGAVECARAYQQLAQDFGLTQEQIAERVGKSRAAVANTLRVLRLPKLALEALEKGAITEGHARAILMLEGETSQLTLLSRILREDLSVRRAEELASQNAASKPKKKSTTTVLDPNWLPIQQGISERLGARVELNKSKKGGHIRIEFYSDQDLERIVEALGVSLD